MVYSANNDPFGLGARLTKPQFKCDNDGKTYKQIFLEDTGSKDFENAEELKHILTESAEDHRLISMNPTHFLISGLYNTYNCADKISSSNKVCYYDHEAYLLTLGIRFPSSDYNTLLVVNSQKMKDIVTEYNSLIDDIENKTGKKDCYFYINEFNNRLCKIIDIKIDITINSIYIENDNISTFRESIFDINRKLSKRKNALYKILEDDYVNSETENKIEKAIALLNEIREILSFDGSLVDYDDEVYSLTNASYNFI